MEGSTPLVMPTYLYTCTEDHTFEAVRGYDDATIDCLIGVGVPDFPGDREAVTLHACGAKATRHAVYRDQGVVFKGDGFTKSVLPPPPPPMSSTAGETVAVDFEIKDEFAKESYEHDKNVRPYVKEEIRKRKQKEVT